MTRGADDGWLVTDLLEEVQPEPPALPCSGVVRSLPRSSRKVAAKATRAIVLRIPALSEDGAHLVAILDPLGHVLHEVPHDAQAADVRGYQDPSRAQMLDRLGQCQFSVGPKDEMLEGPHQEDGIVERLLKAVEISSVCEHETHLLRKPGASNTHAAPRKKL